MNLEITKSKDSSLLIIEGDRIFFNERTKKYFPNNDTFNLIEDSSIFKNKLFDSFLCITGGEKYDVTVYKKKRKVLIDYLKKFYEIPPNSKNIEFLIIPLRYSLRGLEDAYCLYPLKFENPLKFYQINHRNAKLI